MSYIEREALERKIHTGMTIIQAMQVIVDEPAADVVEVRNARWINDGDEYFPDIKCERCGQRKPILLGNFYFNYCPNCGAKMDGGVGND